MSELKVDERKIEAVVDAIGKLNGMHNPESEAYKIRNPILQKSWARPGKHVLTPTGIRVFDSHLAGYKAATYDVSLKISGKSRAGLNPTNTVADLLECYGFRSKAAVDNIVAFIRRALEDQTMAASTPLSYFLREKEDTPLPSQESQGCL